MWMNFNEFCLTWKSKFPDIDVGDRCQKYSGTSQCQSGFAQVKYPFVLIFDICQFVTHLQRRTCQRRNVCGVFGKSSTWWFQRVWHSSTLSEAIQCQCVQRFRPSYRHKWTLYQQHQLHIHLRVQSPGLEVIAWLRKLSTPVWVNWPPDLYQILELF